MGVEPNQIELGKIGGEGFNLPHKGIMYYWFNEGKITKKCC
jgi:hypothetical protein